MALVRWCVSGFAFCVLLLWACSQPALAQSSTLPSCPTTGSVSIFFNGACEQVSSSAASVNPAGIETSVAALPQRFSCQTTAGAVVIFTATYVGAFPACSSPGVPACTAGASEPVWVPAGTQSSVGAGAVFTESHAFANFTAPIFMAAGPCEVSVDPADLVLQSASGGGCLVDTTANASGTFDVSCEAMGKETGFVPASTDVDGSNDPPAPPIGASAPDPSSGGDTASASDAVAVSSGSGSGSGSSGSGGSGTGSGTGASGSSAGGASGASGSGSGTGSGAGGTGGASGAGGASGSGTGSGVGSVVDDLCQIDPSIAACATLGTPAASGVVAASSVAISLAAVSVGGPSNPVCPLPQTFSFFGQSFSLSFDPLCQLATSVQPLVLALCGLAAGLIVVSGLKS